MTWQIGIDEAGYGPNLGPLVMTATALRTGSRKRTPWQALGGCVRRHGEPDDGRLLVADSKLVFSTARGLGPLEKSVLAILIGGFDILAPHLAGLLSQLCPEPFADLGPEPWYHGETKLPSHAELAALHTDSQGLRRASDQAGISWGFCRSLVVCAPRFNDLVDRWDNKGAVLSLGLVQLMRACVAELPEEPLCFVIDKQGGRNFYGAILQEAFPAGFVEPQEERGSRSFYHVRGMGRPVEVTLVPRADAEHFSVALASMICKYVREVLMGEFNAFWHRHIPGLKATAGYPGDSSRFFAEIRPLLEKLGLSERQIWRQR